VHAVRHESTETLASGTTHFDVDTVLRQTHVSVFPKGKKSSKIHITARFAEWKKFGNVNLHSNVVTKSTSKCTVLIHDFHFKIDAFFLAVQYWLGCSDQFIVYALFKLEVLQNTFDMANR
jgi:hypothetical protein